MSASTPAPVRNSILAASLGLAMALPAFAQQPAQATAPPRTVEQTIEATAKVTAVDAAKREVTLKNDAGEITTIAVGDEVKRFDEIEVGDTVRARYTIGITGELRPATEEEKKEPFIAVEGGGRSPEGTAPGAGGARMVRIVATIQEIDAAAQTVTLKGPNGNVATVKTPEADVLALAKVGDTVVVTAAESVAVSLEKVAGKKKK